MGVRSMKIKIIQIVTLIIVGITFTNCGYTQSALNYAQEGSKRVEAGYKAKADMTKYLTEYLTKANEGCGVKVEIIDNKPITTVKECIRPNDVLQAVNNIQIVQPQQVNDMLQSAGDFFVKATNVVVPTASIYYGYKNNQVNQQANVAIRQSDNEAQTSMWANYTGSYQNTSVTDTSNTSVTKNTTTTNTTMETTNETTIPSINVDINSTSIGM